MSAQAEGGCPKLRPIDARPFVRNGQPSILLRDPLQLTKKTVVIPQHLAPVLALCDGTRDTGALSAALALRFGLRVTPGTLEQLLEALDEALLLENERSAQARQQALAAYREAPFRSPVVAGESYSDDAEELRRQLDSQLDAVEDVSPGFADGRGLVSPHIDYARGGPVYAQAWGAATEMASGAELVVLLGTDHHGEDGRLTLTRQHYATPFGVLPTAQEVVDALARAMGEEASFADELHHRSEHSIELAAVWLHHVRQGKPCELVPILCGSFGHFVRDEAEPDQDPAISALVDTLRPLVDQGGVLVVAAADLSHVGPAFGGRPVDILARARLQAADDELIERMCAGDAEGFLGAVKRAGDQYNVCGLPPIYLALRLLSPVEGQRIAYARCPADEAGTSLVSICGILFG